MRNSCCEQVSELSCSSLGCSLTKARYGDWQSLHQKYGATAFVTVPLDVAAGVVGTITAAGGPKLNIRAVQMLAVRLGEVLLRRTTERLMKVCLHARFMHKNCVPRHVSDALIKPCPAHNTNGSFLNYNREDNSPLAWATPAP